MKSIDEAGVEWHLSHPEANKEETWKAGANYVLDHLSMTISVSEDGYLRDNLRKMIEQLKKK